MMHCPHIRDGGEAIIVRFLKELASPRHEVAASDSLEALLPSRDPLAVKNHTAVNFTLRDIPLAPALGTARDRGHAICGHVRPVRYILRSAIRHRGNLAGVQAAVGPNTIRVRRMRCILLVLRCNGAASERSGIASYSFLNLAEVTNPVLLVLISLQFSDFPC